MRFHFHLGQIPVYIQTTVNVNCCKMATDSSGTTFDELEPVNNPDSEDSDKLSLEPGDAVVVELRAIEQNVGEFKNSRLHVTTDAGDGEFRWMWSNSQIDKKLAAADAGPGDVVGIKKSDEMVSFENDDGEKIEYYEFEVRA